MTGATGQAGTFTAAERTELLALGRRRSYAAGTILYHEGDESDWVVYLERGWARVSASTADGREAVFALLGPGEVFGELAAFDQQPRSATITALEDVTAWIVSSGEFRRFVGTHPRVATQLLETMSRRLREADRIRVEFGGHDTQARVCRRLVDLAERFGVPEGAGLRIDLSISHEELASWIGASREAVSRALGSLRKRGWIVTGRRRITVLDLDSLRRGGR